MFHVLIHFANLIRSGTVLVIFEMKYSAVYSVPKRMHVSTLLTSYFNLSHQTY